MCKRTGVGWVLDVRKGVSGWVGLGVHAWMCMHLFVWLHTNMHTCECVYYQTRLWFEHCFSGSTDMANPLQDALMTLDHI